MMKLQYNDFKLKTQNSKLKTPPRGGRGQAITEFSLLLPVLLLIVLGGMQIGFIVFNYMKLTHAVETGAQYAASSSTVWASDSNIQNYINQMVPSWMVGKLTYSFSPSSVSSRAMGYPLEIRVGCNFKTRFFIPTSFMGITLPTRYTGWAIVRLGAT